MYLSNPALYLIISHEIDSKSSALFNLFSLWMQLASSIGQKSADGPFPETTTAQELNECKRTCPAINSLSLRSSPTTIHPAYIKKLADFPL